MCLYLQVADQRSYSVANKELVSFFDLFLTAVFKCFGLHPPFLVNLGIAHLELSYQILSLKTEIGVGVTESNAYRGLVGIIKKQVPS